MFRTMKTKLFKGSLLVAIAVSAVSLCESQASAELPNMWPLRRAQYSNWHGNYAYSQYGKPVALVIPPTATMQTNWGWGVGSSRISRIDHQYGRNYQGQGQFGGGYRATGRWPQDTNQYGVYYIRGPW